MLSTLTMPLAEGGYYVIPVTIMNEMTVSDEIQKAPLDKLHQIFSADTALYVTIKGYGNDYHAFEQRTRVSVSAQIVDLRTGIKLWEGKALAVDSSGVALNPLNLITVIVDQVISSMTEQARIVFLISPQILCLTLIMPLIKHSKMHCFLDVIVREL